MDDTNIHEVMKLVAKLLGWTGGKQYQTVVNQVSVRGHFHRGEKGQEVKSVQMKVKATTDFWYREED